MRINKKSLSRSNPNAYMCINKQGNIKIHISLKHIFYMLRLQLNFTAYTHKNKPLLFAFDDYSFKLIECIMRV